MASFAILLVLLLASAPTTYATTTTSAPTTAQTGTTAPSGTATTTPAASGSTTMPQDPTTTDGNTITVTGQFFTTTAPSSTPPNEPVTNQPPPFPSIPLYLLLGEDGIPLYLANSLFGSGQNPAQRNLLAALALGGEMEGEQLSRLYLLSALRNQVPPTGNQPPFPQPNPFWNGINPLFFAIDRK